MRWNYALFYPQQGILSHYLERIYKDTLDKQLRCTQAGLREGRSCIDSIATLREIIEPSNECPTPLYMHMIDF